MNMQVVEKIANAVLYEGYLLYPYRASAVKNRQRFNFGVLYPREHCDLQQGSDTWQTQTECLVIGDANTRIEVKVRFLQLVAREDRQEGIEREFNPPACALDSLPKQPLLQWFAFDGGVEAEAELDASRIDEGLYRIRLLVRNCAALDSTNGSGRDEVLLRSLVSAHSILHVSGGSFVSLMDPPDQFRLAAAECRNIGTWPVLVGDEGQRDLLLSSPIILYDYPEVAPESPGDLFDGLEIDEILALRILTLTDEEKLEVRNGDERARGILERTEMLPPEHFQKLHGALRGLRESSEEVPMNEWEFNLLEAKQSFESIFAGGVEIRVGDPIRLRPRQGGDIMDAALAGKLGILESIEQDYEGKIHVAVVVDDDPGRDLGLLRQPGHRFFFDVEEIEPL